MPQRPLDARLGRVEGRRAAVASENSANAIRQRQLLRVEAAIGAVIREALVRNKVEPAGVARLALADEAATALAAIPDTPELRRADLEAVPAAKAPNRGDGDVFAGKIMGMSRVFAGAPPPDFAAASFAELFAWSLAAAGGCSA